jgi:hypothetical protein
MLPVFLALVVGPVLGPACIEKVDPCAEVMALTKVVKDQCPMPEWHEDESRSVEECNHRWADLSGPVAHDLDWCVGCMTRHLTDATELDCSSAPLSARDCSDYLNETLPLLHDTLDASCFPVDATPLP